MSVGTVSAAWAIPNPRIASEVRRDASRRPLVKILLDVPMRHLPSLDGSLRWGAIEMPWADVVEDHRESASQSMKSRFFPCALDARAGLDAEPRRRRFSGIGMPRLRVLSPDNAVDWSDGSRHPIGVVGGTGASVSVSGYASAELTPALVPRLEAP
jgi:hypothetical protein